VSVKPPLSKKEDIPTSNSNDKLNSIGENEVINGKIERNIKFYNPPKDNSNQSNRSNINIIFL